MELHEESRHIIVIRRGQFCESWSHSRLFSTRPESRASRLNLPFLPPSSSSDWFDALDSKNRPTLTERDILSNLTAIVTDADKTPIHEVSPIFPGRLSISNPDFSFPPSPPQVAQGSIGVLSTENRKVWSTIRNHIMTPAKG